LIHPESIQDESLELLVEEIRQKHGSALLAILVYGSWLRGKRDTMLDFYVLVEDYHTLDSAWQGWMCRLLPPNVYHIHHKTNDPEATAGQELRAKYALLTLDRFRHAMKNDFHSYFWARFAQPCKVLYARDDATQAELADAFKSASTTFVRRVIPAMGDRFSSGELTVVSQYMTITLLTMTVLQTQLPGKPRYFQLQSPKTCIATRAAVRPEGSLR